MSQPRIDIYTKFGCPFCTRAKNLLDQKGAKYHDHDITVSSDNREEMMRRAPDAKTVPQIFIGDTHVAGSDVLMKLEEEGRLDKMLAGE